MDCAALKQFESSRPHNEVLTGRVQVQILDFGNQIEGDDAHDFRKLCIDQQQVFAPADDDLVWVDEHCATHVMRTRI